MCSVVVVLESGERPSISIAANRDEDRGRPAEGPRWRETGELSSRAVFAPRDLKAGGTWWGLNDVSLLVAVTNRMTGRRTQPEGWRSRGLLVSEILGAQTLEEAQLRLEGSDLTETRGFHLLGVPRIAWRAFVGRARQRYSRIRPLGRLLKRTLKRRHLRGQRLPVRERRLRRAQRSLRRLLLPLRRLERRQTPLPPPSGQPLSPDGC